MQRPISWLVALTVLAIGPSLAFADDKDKTPTEVKKPSAEEKSEAELIKERFAEIAQQPPGVPLDSIKKNKKGRIVSCLVVAKSRISTVLGKAKGIETARDRANLQASAEFVKWLKQDVRVTEGMDDETIILMTGTEGSDGETNSESGKAIEKTSKKMEAVSQGLVRGLVAVYSEIDAESQEYIVIKGWKADTAEAVKKVAKDLKSDEPKDEKAKPSKSKPADEPESKPTKKSDKEIQSSRTISEGASDFLPSKKK